MGLINWEESLETGIAEIDLQHQRLFTIYNDFHEALRTRKNRTQLRDLILALEAYSKYHFYGEEILMTRLRYPGLMLHRYQHEAYIRHISHFDRRYVQAGAEPRLMVDMLVYLAEWIKKHIRIEDQKYNQYLKSRRVNVLHELTAAMWKPVALEALAKRLAENPPLIKELYKGLISDVPSEVLDCAEMLQKVAQINPTAIARQAEKIAVFIGHENPELAVWAAETLLLVADKASRVIASVVPELKMRLHGGALDPERDTILRVLSRYARSSRKAAEIVFPIVRETMTVRVNPNLVAGLEALAAVAESAPHLSKMIRTLAQDNAKDNNELIRKAARGLLKATELRDQR